MSREPPPAAAPPLRFCMVSTFYPPFNFGGDGIAIQRLARGLVKRGHDVTVLHDADAYGALADEDPPDPEPHDDEGVEVLPLRRRRPATSMLLTHQTGRPVTHRAALRRILDGDRFDVVNFHNVSLVGGPGILAYGDAVKLYTAHEHWLVCPTHVLWRHGREPCPERQCLRCTLRARRPPQLWRYTGYLERQLRHVDAFIAMSEFSRRKHMEFGFPREMEVVPPPVPDEPLDTDAGPAPHPRPYFVYAGRLERLKGLDDVLPLFSGDGPDLVIAGSGTHESELRRIAAGSDRIHFLGSVPGEELARLYRGALALIMPSVGYETFGLTVVEAFRASLPVLARAVGPLPEIVEQSGGAGQLFTTADELAAAAGRIAADPGLRERMGRLGRAAFEQRWSEQATIPRYLDVVARASATRGGGRPAGRMAA